SRVTPYSVGNLEFISPDRSWITAIGANEKGGGLAVPVTGAAPRRICGGCPANWSPDGKFLYVGIQPDSLTDPGKTLAIPLAAGEILPAIPDSGVESLGSAGVPGSRMINGYNLSPSSDPSIYAYVKTTMHRNLFRIPLRD